MRATGAAPGELQPWGPGDRNWLEWSGACTTRGVTLATRAGARARAVRDLAAFFERTLVE